MRLGSREIGLSHLPYLLAEVGVNHDGDLDYAKRLIAAAARGGADCVKFQAYKADTIAAVDSQPYWDRSLEPSPTQHALFSRYDKFGPAEFEALAAECERVGIDFACTPFDLEAVEWLDPLVKFHKIASADLTNIPLLRAVGRKGKPVILSTGASSGPEIARAVRDLESAGSGEVSILHCVLAYPTANEDAHLQMIDGLRQDFPLNVIGYSDHTRPEGDLPALLAATILGARILEKHFTDDKVRPGNDRFHSCDESDLIRFGRALRKIWPMLGDMPSRAEPLACEAESRLHARRSLYLAKPVTKGHKIEPADLICLRPGTGISPTQWDSIIGRVLTRDVPQGAPLAWSDFEEFT